MEDYRAISGTRAQSARGPSYRTKQPPVRDCSVRDGFIAPAIVILALVFHLAGAVWTVTAVPFPSHVDELQHLSYIEEMGKRPALFPRYEAMRVLGEEGRAFTAKGNYLNHPSLYYLLLANLQGADGKEGARIGFLRAVNVALSALGVLLMLYGGRLLLPQIESFAAFCLIVVMFPKMPVVAGLINNDNFGVLAAGLCFAGLAQVHRRGGIGSGALLGLGLALAGWSKLTVLVMAGVAVLAAEVFRFGGAPDRRRLVGLGVAGLGAAAGLLPTLGNYAAYGAPLFIYVDAAHNFVPIADRPDLSFLSHALVFFQNMVLKWPALEPAGVLQIASLAVSGAALAAVSAGWILDRWRQGTAAISDDAENAARRLAVAYAVSTAATLGIHLLFGWRMFQEMGDLTAGQPRYYYVVWPGLALGCALAIHALPEGRWRFYGAVGMILLFGFATIQLAALSAAISGVPLSPR